MNTRAAVIATTRAAQQPGGAPAPRDNSAGRASSPVLRIGGGVCSLVPRRHQNSAGHAPNGRGDCSPGTSLNLPGGSRRPAFSPLSGGQRPHKTDRAHGPQRLTGNARGGAGLPSAAPTWCSEGEMPTATGTQDRPFMRPAFDPSGMSPDRRGCGPVQLAEPPRADLVNPQTAALGPREDCATARVPRAAAIYRLQWRKYYERRKQPFSDGTRKDRRRSRRRNGG